MGLYKNNNGTLVPIAGRGQKGDTGEGIADGGTAGQILTKASGTDYDTEWTSLDTTPTNESTNPVTSGGVYSAISNMPVTRTFTIDDDGGGTQKITFPGQSSYILSISGMNGGTYAVYMGIGYGATTVRHVVTKLVAGGGDSVFTVEVNTDSYGVTVTSTYAYKTVIKATYF